jgi:hypothetical protein
MVLAIGSVLAGCAANTRHAADRGAAEGAALPRETAVSEEVRALIPDPQHDRTRSWSVREFMQPRGLYQD